MAEIWFVSPVDRTSGFSFVLLSSDIDISTISGSLADRGFKSIATLSNDNSQYLAMNDCAISIHLCNSDGEASFIGGYVRPQLSKLQVMGKIALATLLLGVVFIMLVFAFALIFIIGTILDSIGITDITQILGEMFFPVLTITIITGLILVPFIIAIFAIPYPAHKTLSVFRDSIKDAVRTYVPDAIIYEFQIRSEPKAEKLAPEISKKIEIISGLDSEETYLRILEYISQY